MPTDKQLEEYEASRKEARKKDEETDARRKRWEEDARAEALKTKPLLKQTVDLPASFKDACKAAGVEATQRQYRKFLKKQGQAYCNR